MGVPDKIILRCVRRASNIFDVLLFADFNLWPVIVRYHKQDNVVLEKSRLTFVADDQPNGWTAEWSLNSRPVSPPLLTCSMPDLHYTCGISISQHYSRRI
jgi:hypothetical protein